MTHLRPITFSWMVGFQTLSGIYMYYHDNMMCPCKSHVASLMVKVTLRTKILCKGCSETCSRLAHNFILHGVISKLDGTNDHYEKLMHGVQETFR